MATLFEQLGGHDKLEAMVAQFYQFVLNDERINYFFLERVSDIPKLHRTMVQFLTGLFGGPNHYTGPDMITLHKHMEIKQIHFDITWEHMEASFLIHKLSKDLIGKLRAQVYSQELFIVNTK